MECARNVDHERHEQIENFNYESFTLNITKLYYDDVYNDIQ